MPSVLTKSSRVPLWIFCWFGLLERALAARASASAFVASASSYRPSLVTGEIGKAAYGGVPDASTSPPKERYAVSNDNVIHLIQSGIFDDQLTEVLRNGARALLAKAIEAEA